MSKLTARDKQDLLNYFQATLCNKEKMILRKIGFNDSEQIVKHLTTEFGEGKQI